MNVLIDAIISSGAAPMLVLMFAFVYAQTRGWML